MKQELFTGTCTAMVTPFIGGQVNYPMMEQLLQRQINANIPAVVICGTTGESATLSDREKIALFARCKAYAGEKMKIICGTGSNDTVHAVELSQAAQEAGADALLIVSPYYNKATDDGLFAHYLSIAHNVTVPIILYNVPSRTGVDIPVHVYKRLSKIANIVGVKEASTDVVKILRTLIACEEDFCVWSGNDELAAAAISVGAKGLISVASNVAPEATSAMVAAALDGDFDTAATLQSQLLPLIDLLFCEVNPIPVKAAMQLIGYDCGECRLPLCHISGAHYEKLKEFLRK